MRRTVVIALFASLAAAAGARAQEAGVRTRPPVELGLGGSRLLPLNYGDTTVEEVTQPTVDLRASVPVSRRFGLEGVAAIGRAAGDGPGIEGLFFVHVKQRLPRLARGRATPFLLYGGVGYLSHVRLPADTIVQPGGEIVARPARSYTEWDPPLVASLGGGVDYRVGPRFALRADAAVAMLVHIPVGLRVSASASVPLGRYSRN